MNTQHSIYFDNNIFHRLIKNYNHWERLSELLDKEEPGLLANGSFMLFTWAQLLEVCHLGPILTKIETTSIWKERIVGKNLIDSLGYQEALGIYFKTAREALGGLPSLQKEALLKNIDHRVSLSCEEGRGLITNTLLRYRDRISSNSDYPDHLLSELAWAFLTSYPFVKSNDQWKKREICYESLIALWHRLRLEGHDLVLFRITEQYFHSFLLHSPKVDMSLYPEVKSRKDLVNKVFPHGPPLGEKKDLCDGELIHYACLGNKTDEGTQTHVIGITTDRPEVIQQRMKNFNHSLSSLSNLNGWSVATCPGKILSLDIPKDGPIQLHRILAET